jgi:hypothetical protein
MEQKKLELFFSVNEGIRHSLKTLVRNLKDNIDDFKVYTQVFSRDRGFFKLLDEIKEKGDASAHSIDIIFDPNKINSLKIPLNKYSELLVTTIQNIKATPN